MRKQTFEIKKGCDVILAAGGSGSRFGSEENKIFALLEGRPLIWYSLSLFSKHPDISRIILVHRPEDEKRLRELCREFSAKEILFTEGGGERKDSVYRGLVLCREEFVIVHDAARPFLNRKFIDRCLKALEDYPAVTLGVPSKDTIKMVNEKDEVEVTLPRSRTWLIQTPQAFRRAPFLKAHSLGRDVSGITDDCMLMERAGYKVKVLMGDYKNRKITTPDDL